MSGRPTPYRVRIFALRRLLGLVQVVDGLVKIVSPFRTGLPLRVARAIARERERKEAKR